MACGRIMCEANGKVKFNALVTKGRKGREWARTLAADPVCGKSRDARKTQADRDYISDRTCIRGRGSVKVRVGGKDR